MNTPIQIAIVEDSPEILDLLSRSLDEVGYVISPFPRAADFERASASATWDLCIIDLGLPDKDGLALVEKISASSDAAILVISGRAALEDRIVGLELGADDYISKPFEIREVIARVNALIRRSAPASSDNKPNRYAFSGWIADLSLFTLTSPDGLLQKLSASEAMLLQIFLEKPNQLISRAQLQIELDDKSDTMSFDRAIDVRVSRLRAKMKGAGQKSEIIKTIYGAGYIFVSEVS